MQIIQLNVAKLFGSIYIHSCRNHVPVCGCMTLRDEQAAGVGAPSLTNPSTCPCGVSPKTSKLLR